MNILFYMTILLFQPIFNMAYMYYTIWTIKNRSWGGPRVNNEILDNEILDNLNPTYSLESNLHQLTENDSRESYESRESLEFPDKIQIVIV